MSSKIENALEENSPSLKVQELTLAGTAVLGEWVPLTIAGGVPPYTLSITSGSATLDSLLNYIQTDIPGVVKVKVQDSSGNSKTLDLNFSGNFLLAGSVQSFKVSSDFSTIYYTKLNSGVYELHKMNSDGTGSSVLFSKDAIVGGISSISISSFDLTPDNQVIVFKGSGSDGFTKLFSIHTDGSNAVQLSANITDLGQSVQDYKIVSNARVVYTDGEQETGGDIEQWMRTVKLDGTDRKLVHPVFPGSSDGQQIVTYKFADDLSKVFFFTEVLWSGDTSLYLTNTDGSTNATWNRLSPNGVDFWVGQTSGISITNDMSRVGIVQSGTGIYICKADATGCLSYLGSYFAPGAFSPDGQYMLASGMSVDLVKTAASEKVTLGSNSNTYFFVAGSSQLFSTQLIAGQTNVFSTPITTAAAVNWQQLNPIFPAFASVTSLTLSPDKTKFYFLVDDQVDNVFRLYKMNLDGSGAAVIPGIEFDTNITGNSVSLSQISTDESRILFSERVPIMPPWWYGIGNLYLADLANGKVTTLTDRAVSSSTISSISILDDAKKIFYISNQEDVAITNLHRILWPY